jgi:hypothetical protein
MAMATAGAVTAGALSYAYLQSKKQKKKHLYAFQSLSFLLLRLPISYPGWCQAYCWCKVSLLNAFAFIYYLLYIHIIIKKNKQNILIKQK